MALRIPRCNECPWHCMLDPGRRGRSTSDEKCGVGPGLFQKNAYTVRLHFTRCDIVSLLKAGLIARILFKKAFIQDCTTRHFLHDDAKKFLTRMSGLPRNSTPSSPSSAQRAHAVFSCGCSRRDHRVVVLTEGVVVTWEQPRSSDSLLVVFQGRQGGPEGTAYGSNAWSNIYTSWQQC